MKELNAMEMQAVSGAGMYGDAGAVLGSLIGTLVGCAFPQASAASGTVQTLGQDIGLMIEKGIDLYQHHSGNPQHA